MRTSLVKLDICPVIDVKFPDRLLRLLDKLSHDILYLAEFKLTSKHTAQESKSFLHRTIFHRKATIASNLFIGLNNISHLSILNAFSLNDRY